MTFLTDTLKQLEKEAVSVSDQGKCGIWTVGEGNHPGPGCQLLVKNSLVGSGSIIMVALIS